MLQAAWVYFLYLFARKRVVLLSFAHVTKEKLRLYNREIKNRHVWGRWVEGPFLGPYKTHIIYLGRFKDNRGLVQAMAEFEEKNGFGADTKAGRRRWWSGLLIC